VNSLIDNLPEIPGLLCLPDFLVDPDALLHAVDALPWLDDLSRRVQHYGWRYDYKSRTIRYEEFLGPLPSFLASLAQRLHSDGLMERVPDQAIVNEYLPGQGIAPHIDCEPCFGPEIATVSLGDEYPMRLTHPETGDAHEIWLPVGSVCVMRGPARYVWKHDIAKRKFDMVGGARRERKRRVSVTFRKVVIG